MARGDRRAGPGGVGRASMPFSERLRVYLLGVAIGLLLLLSIWSVRGKMARQQQPRQGPPAVPAPVAPVSR